MWCKDGEESGALMGRLGSVVHEWGGSRSVCKVGEDRGM